MTTDQTSVSATLSKSIALLTELAERGEIDPWDVQVIEVIDRYLSKLFRRQDSDKNTDLSDLSESGQAFLHASMLVWLKANSLDGFESSDPQFTELEASELLEPDDIPSQRMPLRLEKQLRRRAVVGPPRTRRVTLQELIEQLQLIGAALEEKNRRPRPRPMSSKARSEAAQAIAELAHQENLVETATLLDQFLAESWSQMAQGQEWLELDQLLQWWSPALLSSPINSEHPHTQTKGIFPQYDRVGVFWALLLLSAQSKVELTQDEFYQDLKIRTLNLHSLENRSVIETEKLTDG